MIRELLVEGLLGLEAAAVTLDPKGRNVASGPSECGKSTLQEALCLAFWGQGSDGKPFPVAAIRDDSHGACTVEVTLGSGTKIHLVTKRDRKWQATVTAKDGTVHRPTKRDEVAALLGPIGADPEAARLILVPFAWQALANGPGGGRPFADFLARILPAGDLKPIVAELMAPAALEARDSLDVKGAEQQRATEKTSLAETRGKLAHLREEAAAAGRAVPVGPSDAEVAEARAVVAARAPWLAYNQAKIAHDNAKGAQEKAELAVKRWREDLEKLGAEPPEAPKPSDAEARSARSASRGTEIAVEKARSDEARALKAREKAGAGVCGACKQALPQELVARVVDAHEEAQAAMKLASEDDAAAVEKERAAILAYETALGAHEAAREWAKARKLFGPCPEVPTVEPLRSPPPGVEPVQTQIAAAETTLRDAERATGAAGEQDRRRARVAAQLVTAETEERDGSEELLRIERLVAAVRRAPSVLAARQLACLGDLGPVGIELPETGDAAVVTLDGRPWFLASTGRQIVGDVWLRMAIRRAKRWPWMMMIVDRAQDVGGQPIPDARPCLELHTTADGELAVTAVGDLS